jgi:protein-S-isoprenylcysteine O-methyltransferase Ste14
VLRIVFQALLFLGCLATCLFGSAGTVDWPFAWVFLGVMAVFILAGLLLIDRDLLIRRGTAGHRVQRWDLGLASGAAIIIFPLTLATAGLDVQRYHWTSPLPPAMRLCGLLLFVGGYAFALRAMRENRFFETFVRLQHDQGHYVVTTGPYAYLRHPGYAGAILAHASIPFVLGSRWALVPALCGALLFVARTWLEDRTLQAELAGYRQYVKSVRWRLIPNVW